MTAMKFEGLGISRVRMPYLAAVATLFLLFSVWTLGFNSPVAVAVAQPSHPQSQPQSQLPQQSQPQSQPQSHEADADKLSSHLSQPDPPATKTLRDRPLILYAFFDTEVARANLEFFLAHGLHDAADFVFILNGETDVHEIIPKAANIRYVRRENRCYDLGAFAEVLTTDNLYKNYKRFITMNASIRGPFVPIWSDACWSDLYLNRITDEVKLVGMTVNCEIRFHVQSMIWATDLVGIETLLYPSQEVVDTFLEAMPEHNPNMPVPPLATPGINWCPDGYWSAVSVEVHATALLQAAGYQIDVLMAAFRSGPNFETSCRNNGNVLINDHYYGINIHPYEMIFTKANRDIYPLQLDRYTEWTNGRNYSSYDYCKL